MTPLVWVLLLTFCTPFGVCSEPQVVDTYATEAACLTAASVLQDWRSPVTACVPQ